MTQRAWRTIATLLLTLAVIGCGDTFTRRPGARPEIGDAPARLSGKPTWQDSTDASGVYVVTDSDYSFYDVAQHVYGDGDLWPLILEANPHVNEDDLGRGQQLVIPSLPPAPSDDDDPITGGRRY